jgi:hypothetical protein
MTTDGQRALLDDLSPVERSALLAILATPEAASIDNYASDAPSESYALNAEFVTVKHRH